MSSTYGEHLHLSLFGQSHGAGIGMTLDGIPAGLPVDLEALQAFLNRRAPGFSDLTTAREEADRPEFLSGLYDGYTCGAPLAAVIYNHNTRPSDYSDLKDCPRPGHADYTAQVKYGGFQDSSGGGHFSGRLTAALCIAGGLCIQWLNETGIRIGTHIRRIGPIEDRYFNPVCPELHLCAGRLPVLDHTKAAAIQSEILDAKASLDSVGGEIECAVTGIPAGLGEPIFGGAESKLAQLLYSIPAVKGVEFGAGFRLAAMRGSQSNDAFTIQERQVCTVTNNAGGVLGGITNGMPLIFRVAVKPTPSIAQPQQTVDLKNGAVQELVIHGRHDPCIIPRALPVVEAAAAIALYDLMLMNTRTDRRK